MNHNNPYASIGKRTFESALVHLLETEYGLLGGRRILQLLAEDVAEFYPATERASSGTLLWTCTADDGGKARPGKRAEDYRTVTVQLPLVTPAEVQDRLEQRPTRAKERETQRAARLVQAAAEQGGLLTIAELSVILNKGYDVTRTCLQDWMAETGELLPLKGYQMDQGASPTHKTQIVRLYEQGLEPPDVARVSGHSLKSVERYLKDYERVKLLVQRGMSVPEISSLTGRGQSVILEYVEVIREHHPELLTSTDPDS
jgi:hypothetical protein